MTAPITTKALISLTIDGRLISVPQGTTVFTAAKELGIEIPIFCYHDRMPPFGACRVCLVEVNKSSKLQTSCTLVATEGMQVTTQSKLAVDGRNEILEFLLINHPLDCPICDRGGECPLQDNALKFGPGQSRFYEEKRHFVKPIVLSPVLMLDRERCIVCARCTRFGDEVAGDHALEFIDRGFRTEVGTAGGGPVESKFIGNTIQICPVGALTSRAYRFLARPWDNDSTDSTCTLCPVGCSMIFDARDGEIMRTRSRENREVNDIWLCDKGWFGYAFSTSDKRLTQPLIRRDNQLQPATWEQALTLVAAKFKEAVPRRKIAALGGNPLTVEENLLFQRLIRQGARVNHVDHRVGLPIFAAEDEGLPPGMEMAISACETLDYAVLFGLDITEEFPVIWLRLFRARQKGAPVAFVGHYTPEVGRHLSQVVLHSPGRELEKIEQQLQHVANWAAKGKQGALFVGRQYLYHPQRRAILARLSAFRESTPGVTLNLLEGSGNSLGARFAGMRPDVGPMGEILTEPGMNAWEILQQAANHNWDFLYVAGADPARRFQPSLWKEARARLGFLVVQGLFLSETAQQADVVLPTLSFIEKEGTFINIEGRVQKLRPAKALPDNVFSDAAIFSLLAQKLDLPFEKSDLAATLQQGRLPCPRPLVTLRPSETRAQPPQNNRLRATFAPALFDNGVRMKHNPRLLQMTKLPKMRIHPDEAKARGVEDGDVVLVSASGGSVEGPLHWDVGVACGTIVLPIGYDSFAVEALDNAPLINGLEIDITKVE
jgi:NADH-quinone oxidoreductase subunit G